MDSPPSTMNTTSDDHVVCHRTLLKTVLMKRMNEEPCDRLKTAEEESSRSSRLSVDITAGSGRALNTTLVFWIASSSQEHLCMAP